MLTSLYEAECLQLVDGLAKEVTRKEFAYVPAFPFHLLRFFCIGIIGKLGSFDTLLTPERETKKSDGRGRMDLYPISSSPPPPRLLYVMSTADFADVLSTINGTNLPFPPSMTPDLLFKSFGFGFSKPDLKFSITVYPYPSS